MAKLSAEDKKAKKAAAAAKKAAAVLARKVAAAAKKEAAAAKKKAAAAKKKAAALARADKKRAKFAKWLEKQEQARITRFAKKHKGSPAKTLTSKMKAGNKLAMLRAKNASDAAEAAAKAAKKAQDDAAKAADKAAAMEKPGFLRTATDRIALAARRNPMSLKKAKALLSRKRPRRKR